MGYITIDVDLDEFDDDDILYEAIHILKSSSKGKKAYRETLKSMIAEYAGKKLNDRSLLDEMKFELFENHHHTKTLDEIERFFRGS